VGGKSGQSQNDYYGHCAGIVCQGQLDFIWGLMVQNTLEWPQAKIWDSQIWPSGKTFLYTDGNVWQTLAKTDQDPPNAPWALIATSWTAGTYAAGTLKFYNGYLWKAATGGTNLAPPSAPTLNSYGNADDSTITNGWLYVSTPPTWASQSGNKFWAANSVVAWEGRLYQTPSATKAQPPAAPWVLWKQDRSSSPNPLKMTIPNYGDAYLYWGTPDQTLDTANENILAPLGHPPYRNRAVIVLKNFLFGTMQVNPPDIVVLGGRKPVQSLIIGAATDFDADWQVNPWCVLAEILTHPVIGLGLPLSWFNAATWQAEADRCAANPQLYYISPMWTSLSSVRQIVADLLSYPDAFIFWSAIAQLTAGHWPHGEAAPVFDATTTVNRNNLIEEIAAESDGWFGTKNSVIVSFRDIQAGFKSRPALAPNLFNMSVTRRLQSAKIDRPHIVRIDQATAWATEFAKINGDQQSKGTLTVRAETVSAITPGNLFLLTDDELQTSEVQRCTRKVISAPPIGTAKLTHETERGVSPLPYWPTAANPSVPQGPPPAPVTDAAFVQLPTALAGEPNALAVLAARQNDFTSALEVWFQQADGAAYQSLGVQRGFAVAGQIGYHASETFTINNPTPGASYTLTHGGVSINGMVFRVDIENQYGHGTEDGSLVEGQSYYVDYANGIITLDANLSFFAGEILNVSYISGFGLTVDSATPQSDIDNMVSTLTADEINNNELLCFAVTPDGVGIFSVCAVHSTITPGFYYVYCVPTYNTPPLSGTIWYLRTGQLYIIKRSDVTALTHQSFAGLAAGSATANFILSPQSAWVDADITDIYDPANNPNGLSTKWQFAFQPIYPPSSSLISLLQNGNLVSDFTNTNFATTDVITANVQLTDANADMNKVTLTAYLGAAQVTLNSQTLAQTGSRVFTSQFSLPTAGAWDIVCTVGDASGNATQTTLCTVNVKTSSAPLPSPAILSYTRSGLYVTNLTFKTPNTFGGASTTGLTVKYQLVTLGQSYNDANWLNVTGTPGGVPSGYTGYGPIPNFARETYTLYAKATKTGSNDSVVVSWNL
jgi:hypothetical protein